MRIYPFSAGYIACEKETFSPGGGDAWGHVPVPFYLICHKGKHVLFDTGNPASIIGRVIDEKARQRGMVMTQAEYAPNAISAVGIRPEDVDLVLLSHLHVDHVGAAQAFPNATVVVRLREYLYAQKPDDFMAHVYAAFQALPDLNWYLIPGDEPFDPFGDGRLTLISTPGHTPGHQSLLLNTDQSGAMLLTADACYSKANLTGRLLPQDLVCDRTAYFESLDRIRLYQKAGVTVITGHDEDEWAHMKHAPVYYT